MKQKKHKDREPKEKKERKKKEKVLLLRETSRRNGLAHGRLCLGASPGDERGAECDEARRGRLRAVVSSSGRAGGAESGPGGGGQLAEPPEGQLPLPVEERRSDAGADHFEGGQLRRGTGLQVDFPF